MKKTPLVAMLGAALLVGATAGAAAITLGIDPPTQDVAIGSTVNVRVAIAGLGSGAAPSVSTFDLDVAFDDTILSFVDFTFGDPSLGNQLALSGAGGSITDVTLGVGTVNVFELSLESAADLNALQADSFALGTLRFSALSPGESDIALSVNALGDATGAPLTLEIVDGRVAVSGVSVAEPASVLLLLAGVVSFLGVRARALDRRSRRD